jgi:hypothetical protein
MQAQDPEVAYAVGCAREREECIPAVLRGEQGEKQDGEAETRPREVKIGERILLACAFTDYSDSDQRNKVAADEEPRAHAKW